MKRLPNWKYFSASFFLCFLPILTTADDTSKARETESDIVIPNAHLAGNERIWETFSLLADSEATEDSKVAILQTLEEELADPNSERLVYFGLLSSRYAIPQASQATGGEGLSDLMEEKLNVKIKASEYLFSKLGTDFANHASHCLSLMWGVCSPGDSLTTFRFSESAWKRIIEPQLGLSSDAWASE